jgi:hypothetical protein
VYPSLRAPCRRWPCSDRNPRILEEAETLAKLHDRTIVASHGDPIDAAGLTGIVLT